MGRVLNTHQQWLGQQLAMAGHELGFQQTIPDNGEAIETAVKASTSRSELVIVTGGLGPTSDDITRERIAELLGMPLEEHPETRARVIAYFQERNRPIPKAVFLQAQVPEGARVFPNDHGTAPGLAMRTAKGWLILLPGPPRELRPMYTAYVTPLLAEELPPTRPMVTRTFKTMGIGESVVEERIERELSELVARGLEIGYCARMGEVDVRMVAYGSKGPQLIKESEVIIRQCLEKYIFGVDEDRLEDFIVRELRERNQTLVVAESCTGGYLAHRLTNVSGASAVFLAGHCTYSNEAKENTLGVLSESIDSDGAVSERVAREMAVGARLKHRADYALATTGIAGPTGGTGEKPVGTVYIAISTAQGTRVIKECNRCDRETFKYVASQQALNLIRREWHKNPRHSGGV
jgi:nicotinamide-nucleotide amidase